jgi:hypothetical protein
MKKINEPTKNKLIITWKDYSASKIGTERESFRCNSLEAAELALKKRNKRRIYFATFYDNYGIPEDINFNSKDTILAV